MSCSRGKANPDALTKSRLFAESAGYCQNPDCNINLFQEVGETQFHIAEMAHVISAGIDGPRTSADIPRNELGSFSNLILLCPTCHTKVDKAEAAYPEELILSWKKAHRKRIMDLFEIKTYPDRASARKATAPILIANRLIFDQCGPMTEDRFNPESDKPALWKRKVKAIILPNNRKLLGLMEQNYDLLTEDERYWMEVFRQHVGDFEARHLSNEVLDGTRFPIKINSIFE